VRQLHLTLVEVVCLGHRLTDQRGLGQDPPLPLIWFEGLALLDAEGAARALERRSQGWTRLQQAGRAAGWNVRRLLGGPDARGRRPSGERRRIPLLPVRRLRHRDAVPEQEGQVVIDAEVGRKYLQGQRIGEVR